uniref:Uncharacterized protein n=1 Tax=Solanum lycopersicum TaxID=4081 RepID=A0A3Q7FP30_SOLLC
MKSSPNIIAPAANAPAPTPIPKPGLAFRAAEVEVEVGVEYATADSLVLLLVCSSVPPQDMALDVHIGDFSVVVSPAFETGLKIVVVGLYPLVKLKPLLLSPSLNPSFSPSFKQDVVKKGKFSVKNRKSMVLHPEKKIDFSLIDTNGDNICAPSKGSFLDKSDDGK